MEYREIAEVAVECIEGSDRNSNEVFGEWVREFAESGEYAAADLGAIVAEMVRVLAKVNEWRNANGYPLK